MHGHLGQDIPTDEWRFIVHLTINLWQRYCCRVYPNEHSDSERVKVALGTPGVLFLAVRNPSRIQKLCENERRYYFFHYYIARAVVDSLSVD